MDVNTQANLIIENIDVAPLDAQWNAWPIKTVPDALQKPLFGTAELDSDKPPLNTYAVLDAAKITLFDNPEDAGGLPCQCLYQRQEQETLASVAPYLVQLRAEHDFTRTLFTYNPAFPENHASVHLWHKRPGIFIRTRASFDQLWQHLTQFTHIQDEQGKRYFFRFYEPKYLETLFQALTPGELNTLFGPHHLTFFSYSNDERPFFRISQSPDNLHVSAEPILLNQRIRDIFNQGAEQKFMRKALDFCQQNLPAITLKEGEDEQAFVRRAVALAKQNGLRLELAVLYFVAACWVMYPFLDQWLAEVTPKLKQSDLGQPGRAQALLEHALQKRKEIFDE